MNRRLSAALLLLWSSLAPTLAEALQVRVRVPAARGTAPLPVLPRAFALPQAKPLSSGARVSPLAALALHAPGAYAAASQPGLVQSSFLSARSFSLAAGFEKDAEPVAPGDKELLQLRDGVERESAKLLRDELGGELERRDITRQVGAVLRRLQAANAIDRDAVTLRVGGSFIPNAFTAVTDAEIKYLKEKGRLQASFKNSNVYVSRGLIEAFRGHPDATLAFVLAHELAHNRLGHLKSIHGSGMMLGHLLEFEADAEALKMIARAGYDPREALVVLELIEDRVETLKKEYALLQKGSSEYQQLISRWRDIHPNHALRRANLEDHLSEALELYRAGALAAKPGKALARIEAALGREPVRDEVARLEEDARAVVEGGAPFYAKVVALEGLLTRSLRMVKKKPIPGKPEVFVAQLRMEDQLIIENAIRALAKAARTLEDLNNLDQLHQRVANAYPGVNFPSRKAGALIVTRQVEVARKLLGPLAAVSRAGELAGKVSLTALQALFNVYLLRVDTEEGWAQALEYLGANARALGYVPGGTRPSMARALSRTLLRKTLRLLPDEGAPPDERLAAALGYLRAHLPATLIVAGTLDRQAAPYFLSTHLKAEIVDAYLTGRLGARPRLKLADMIFLLHGKTAPKAAEGEDPFEGIRAAGVMEAWNERYFRAEGLELSSTGSVAFNYERLDTKQVAAPSPGEMLELLSLFPYQERAPDALRGREVPKTVPETLAAVILKQDAAWQEAFWEGAGRWALDEYRRRRHHEGADHILKTRLTSLAKLQESVVRRSQRLAPLTAVLNGMTRALEAAAAELGAEGRKTASLVADSIIRLAVNEYGADQLGLARDSKAGIVPEELEALTKLVLKLDADYASFNTASRLRALAGAFHRAVLDGEDLLPLVAYVRYVLEWTRHKGGGGASGTSHWSDNWAARNRRLFRKAGLEKEFAKLPTHIDDTLTSGALGLLADPGVSSSELLGASLALYFKHQKAEIIWENKVVDQTLALLLIEEAARRIRSAEDAESAAAFLLKVHDLDPLFLSYVPREELETDGGLLGARVSQVIRLEAAGALAARKQPFRERDAAVLRALLEAVERQGGWPAATADRLVLLDWAGRAGDYDEWVEDRILEAARRDPEGFRAWMARDRRWTRKVIKKEVRGYDHQHLINLVVHTIEKTLGLPHNSIRLPELKPAPLRLVRNPVRRAELYLELKKGEPLAEKPGHRWLREGGALLGLLKAYYGATRYFSKDFLKSVVRESSPDSRIVMVLQEISRVADEKTDEARRNWEKGRRAPHRVYEKGDKTPRWKRWLGLGGASDPGRRWHDLSELERRYALDRYRGEVAADALKAVMALHDTYANFLDPELGFLVDNFPEPSRARDDLLERLARARKLTPERLGMIESYKSYRLPNPLRFIEKQFLETASLQLVKLTPGERVDLILHLGGARALPEPDLARLEAKMIAGDQKVFIEKTLGIHSFRQYLKYVDQLHPEDKKLFVKSMFFGKGSIAGEPAQVERLYRSLVIDGRGLPPLVENILLQYYGLITPSERIHAITELMGASQSETALAGPQIVRLALANFGITGAKLGQVLATHKGLLPDDYASALEGFKDSAQSLEKWRVLAMLEDKLAAFQGANAGRDRKPDAERREKLLKTALLLFPELDEARRERYVSEVLALERIKEDGGRVSDIEAIGKELGSGSVKVAYKVTLKDGTTWVAKVRRPGATVDFRREFEIVEAIAAGLSADPSLKLPNVSQLLEEVRALVLAELDFQGEARKMERTKANVDARSRLENVMKKGGKVVVPANHPKYLDDDLVLDEFIPSVQFKKLPERGFWRVTKARLAKAIVDEAAQALILDEYIDPDRHSGNILARTRFGLPWAVRPVKPVWIDLGQSVAVPLDAVRPVLVAGLELKYGRTEAAAKALASLFALAPGQSLEELEGLIRPELAVERADLMETLIAAIMRAEKARYLVREEYAALEKAMLLLNGYARWLPADTLMHSMERAVFLRVLRERPRAAWRLAWNRVRELFGADRHDEFLAEILRLGHDDR